MTSHIATGLLAGAFALSVAAAARADCTTDAECKGDRLCDNGACVDPNTPPQPYPPPVPPPSGAPLPAPGPPPPPVVANGPEPGTVPITFRGAEGYVVRSVNEGGQVVQCTVPCTLHLHPGTTEVEVVGEFKDVMEVPSRPANAEITFKRRAMMITGIVLAGFGLGSIALASKERADYNECVKEEGDRSSVRCHGKDTSTGFFIVGAVLASAGVALFVPGILSKTAVTVVDPEPPRAWLRNLKVGFAPRAEGGGFFSARYSF